MPDQLRDDLRAARRASGMSWADFAHAAGFGEAYLRNVENGNRRVTDQVAEAYDRVLQAGGRFTREAAAGGGPAAVPWSQDGAALTVLTNLAGGRQVDRRDFISAGIALSVSATNWGTAIRGRASSSEGTVDGPSLLLGLESRLEHLRRVDDGLGSGEVFHAARSDLSLAVTAIKSGRFTGTLLDRLYATAAEASRQVAWAAFDQGRPGVAQSYFDASLRASAECGDVIGGAYALSFAAIQCYSTPGQARRAVDILDTARARVRGRCTPRMEAMLASRTARSLSKTGDAAGAAHWLHLARTALDKGVHDDDPAVLYWVTEGEIEMIAGSSALELGDTREALRRFSTGMTIYRGDEEYPRTHAIYLARAAEAHLADHDLDAAIATARHAAKCLGGVDSARSASQLKGLREKLAPHGRYRPVAEFLAGG
ncbi:helix-turn-helix transcriptional regulator [Kitasatospora sp. NA04385]|uniref:helix-turn-helix domain-containing protein n=1 Tax=Kitasatospora sp. NA04385 TaxID=2742135 RepID=UPI00159242DD|nr:helix-turn-helix transcriptional regulator [Kitasatospora sp. NA04385]QKW21628.1 helix-turn-helix transcriptional regulator [Kitasatospora sp. NA04385]